MKKLVDINLETTLEDLEYELQEYTREAISINGENIVEVVLIKRLARLCDKAQEFINAYKDKKMLTLCNKCNNHVPTLAIGGRMCWAWFNNLADETAKIMNGQTDEKIKTL